MKKDWFTPLRPMSASGLCMSGRCGPFEAGLSALSSHRLIADSFTDADHRDISATVQKRVTLVVTIQLWVATKESLGQGECPTVAAAASGFARLGWDKPPSFAGPEAALAIQDRNKLRLLSLESFSRSEALPRNG
ncbi:MAG: hypothetical protein AB1896_02815 [Thermodesulfobacteriota bacterium]